MHTPFHPEKGESLIGVVIAAAIISMAAFAALRSFQTHKKSERHIILLADELAVRDAVKSFISCKHTFKTYNDDNDVHTAACKTAGGGLVSTRNARGKLLTSKDGPTPFGSKYQLKSTCKGVELHYWIKPTEGTEWRHLFGDVPYICPLYQVPTEVTCKYEARSAPHHAYGYISANHAELFWHQWRTTDAGFDRKGTGNLWFEKGGRKLRLGDLIFDDTDHANWLMQWFTPEISGQNDNNLFDSEEAVHIKNYFATTPTSTINHGYSTGDTGHWPVRVKDCVFDFKDVRNWPKPVYGADF